MSKVEVFAVGVEQVSDLVRDGRLRDFTHDGMYVPCDGDYVVVECAGCLGYVSRPRLVVSYVSLDKALAAAAAYLAGDARTTYAHDYEVWHVCDDDDLWQAWEHEAWIARMLDGGMYDKVYVLPSGTEGDACDLEGQRKAGACRISLDNGHTYLDPVRDEADMQELITFLYTYPHIWDLIVSGYMDDETREFTHLTSSYTGMLPDEHTSTAMINACWLCDYLMNADSDLVY